MFALDLQFILLIMFANEEILRNINNQDDIDLNIFVARFCTFLYQQNFY